MDRGPRAGTRRPGAVERCGTLGRFAETFEEQGRAGRPQVWGGVQQWHGWAAHVGPRPGDCRWRRGHYLALHFVASANCLLYERAVPRFVDIDEATLGLDPDLVAAAAGPRTKGILPIHVFGRPCQIGAIEQIADRRGWHLVEDACEASAPRRTAPGRLIRRRFVFAFYPNKQVTTGEGGVVVTDDPGSRRRFEASGTRDATTAEPGSGTCGLATTIASTSSRQRLVSRSWSASRSCAQDARACVRVPRGTRRFEWLQLPDPGRARSWTGLSTSSDLRHGSIEPS